MDVSDDLDVLARRADPDRWLASRFIADEAQRADVIALYAFDQELARVPAAVREPMMAEIRLTWWRESVEGLFAGQGARGHPVLTALGSAIERRRLASEPLLAMIEARFDDIDAEPFADVAALETYADGVCGAPMALALAVLGYGDAATLRPAALAWTVARLFHLGAQRLALIGGADEARRLGLSALLQVGPAITALPVGAFPAVAHLALAKAYLKGHAPGELEKRLRLMVATVRGRV